MSNILLFLFGCVLSGVVAQLPHTGDCPDRTPVHSLDARKLSSGVWYENQRTASLVEWPFKCIAFKIQPFFEHKSTLKVTSIHRFTGKLSKLALPLKAVDPEGRNGKIVITIPALLPFENGTHVEIHAQVLAMGANSTTWGVIWSCRSFKKAGLHTENVWVLTREREVYGRTFDEIRDALISLNLEHLVMRDSMQNDCAVEDEKAESESK